MKSTSASRLPCLPGQGSCKRTSKIKGEGYAVGGKGKFKMIQPCIQRTEPYGVSSAVPVDQQVPEKAWSGDDDHPGVAGGRRNSIVWFTNNLRIHDNEPLLQANRESSAILPVFVFDQRLFKKSPAGFRKINSAHLHFILDSVRVLRDALRDIGNDLVLKIGKPEEILLEVAENTDASAIYFQGGFSQEERKVEEALHSGVQSKNIRLKRLSGKTLHHEDDIAPKLKKSVPSFARFCKEISRVKVRAPLEAPAQIKGPPLHKLEMGLIPSPRELGFTEDESRSQLSNKTPGYGGEKEALRVLHRLRSDLSGGRKSKKSCGISKLLPWLADGCISSRKIFAELGLSTSTGSCALVQAILWNDFFQFTHGKQEQKRPAMAY